MNRVVSLILINEYSSVSRKSSQKMWRRKYSGAMEVQQVLTGSCVKWHVKCQLLITPTAAAPESCDEEDSVGAGSR